MHAAALFVAYLCAAALIAFFAWAVMVTAAYAWEQLDAHLLLARRQIRMCRRIHSDHSKGWRQAWADAGLIRRNTIRILEEIAAEDVGLTAEQIRFRNDVERTLWQIPTVEEVA